MTAYGHSFAFDVVACRRTHHPPTLVELDAGGAERLESTYLGLEVVGFDIEVDAAVVVDALEQQLRLVVATRELTVRRLARVRGFELAPECGAPERGGGIDVLDLTVDHEIAQAATVHARPCSSVR